MNIDSVKAMPEKIVEVSDWLEPAAILAEPDKIPDLRTKVICTLGPASLKPRVIRCLQQLGVDLFRINLSHTALEEVRPSIALIQ